MAITQEAFSEAQTAELRNWERHNSDATRILYELVEHSDVAGPLRSHLTAPLEKTLEVGVGCYGLGFLAVHFPDKLVSIDGLDPLPRLEVKLEDVALQEYVDAIRNRVNYIEAKGENLPFDSESYDLVACINVVDHAQDPERIIREIYRVLKPGGLLVFGVSTLSCLGQWKWRFNRRRRPHQWNFLAHPHDYQWYQANRILRRYFTQCLWDDCPTALTRFMGHGRFSSWILRKSMASNTVSRRRDERQTGGSTRDRLKWLLFPGLNLHGHLRYRTIPRFMQRSDRRNQRCVLDAGCGNGMLSYQAYLRGNRVIGVSIKEREIEGNRRLFNGYRRIPEMDLSFVSLNLHDIEQLNEQFDEIICTEVLEHIQRDGELCGKFWRVLKPGGVLHLCCPNANHPDNETHRLDPDESGGHVRSGYTPESYRALLEPIGFQLSEIIGVGGPLRQACNKRIRAVENAFGFTAGFLLFALTWPLQVFDSPNPQVPLSLYVRATKPGRAAIAA